MKKSAIATYRNPLIRFLSESDDYDDLEILARRYFERSFDEVGFRTELVRKLERRPGKREVTFYDKLNNARLLESLLEPNTLRELHECLLLGAICKEDRDLEHKNMTVDGLSRTDHRKALTEINTEFKFLENLRGKYEMHDADFETIFAQIYDKLNRRAMLHLRRISLSKKYKSLRSALLSDDHTGRSYKPRDEDVAAKKAIYWTLCARLNLDAANANGISELFLCQLAELIWASPNVNSLSNGTALLRAVNRAT